MPKYSILNADIRIKIKICQSSKFKFERLSTDTLRVYLGNKP